MQKEEFLLQYNISNSSLEEADVDWKELELIVKEYPDVEFVSTEQLYDIMVRG